MANSFTYLEVQSPRIDPLDCVSSCHTKSARLRQQCAGVMVLYLMLDWLDEQVGGTPLLYAARKGHAEVVKLLLTEGAAVDAADKVVILIRFPSWKCDSAFCLMVCPAHCSCNNWRT